MARRRDVILISALLLGSAGTGASAAPHPAAGAAGGLPLPVQYFQPERGYQAPPQQYYAPPPPPRQTCWTQYTRLMVGYDQWQRPIYRNVPRRVCGYR